MSKKQSKVVKFCSASQWYICYAQKVGWSGLPWKVQIFQKVWMPFMVGLCLEVLSRITLYCTSVLAAPWPRATVIIVFIIENKWAIKLITKRVSKARVLTQHCFNAEWHTAASLNVMGAYINLYLYIMVDVLPIVSTEMICFCIHGL